MWIKGRRRGGAKDLASHLQKTDENESVDVRQLEGFSFDTCTGANLETAIRQMEAIGYGKGDKRNLFHTIIAPAYGEALKPEQKKAMVEYYAEQMGFKGHQYAVVEHWKKGKQHFHLVFNIINPVTGRTHELKWTKKNEWRISRELEKLFGHRTPKPKNKSTQSQDQQRGQRSGLDPIQMRREVTAIYHKSTTAEEFVANLNKSGYALTRGNRDQLVLVDKYGDTHGLMRRIEGQKLADLRKKFPGLEDIPLPLHAELVKARKSAKASKPKHERSFINPHRVRLNVKNAYRRSKSGAAFTAELNSHGYALGRGLKGLTVIDGNGHTYDLKNVLGQNTTRHLQKTFSDLDRKKLRSVSEVRRRIKTKKSGQGVKSRSTAPSVGTFPNTASASTSKPTPIKAESIRLVFKSHAQVETKLHQQQQNYIAPVRPQSVGWPDAAIIDWKTWGFKNPPCFFAKWPELKS